MKEEQGKDIFNDYQVGEPIFKDKPGAVFIGRNNPVFCYGQTGMLLYNGDNNCVFIPDDRDDNMSWVLDDSEYIVQREDIRRVEDLHYGYVDMEVR
jgi:hypothetical protein